MKVIKLNSSKAKELKKFILKPFLHREVDAFKGTRLSFIKNNPDYMPYFNGLLA